MGRMGRGMAPTWAGSEQKKEKKRILFTSVFLEAEAAMQRETASQREQQRQRGREAERSKERRRKRCTQTRMLLLTFERKCSCADIVS